MTEQIVPAISSFLERYLTPELIVFIISMLPILELRGGLIVASLLGVPWYVATPIAIFGNVIPIPFIVIFVERVLGFLKLHGPVKRFAAWLEGKGRRAGDKLLAKHPKSLFLGLLLFVAIPLPGTGAWTGSMAAGLLGLKPKQSLLPISLGVLGACAIMLVLTYLFPALFGFK